MECEPVLTGGGSASGCTEYLVLVLDDGCVEGIHGGDVHYKGSPATGF